MIIDRLEHRGLYAGLGRGIPQALDYLARTDLTQLPDGKQALDGERMYANIQRYKTKPIWQAKWEIHRRYLDVQYIARGAERIGYAPWSEGLAVKEEYDPERDLAFYKAAGVLVPVAAGMFVVLMPQELHAPGLVPAESEAITEVLKVVVKCRWE